MPRAMSAVGPPRATPRTHSPSGIGKNTSWNTTMAAAGASARTARPAIGLARLAGASSVAASNPVPPGCSSRTVAVTIASLAPHGAPGGPGDALRERLLLPPLDADRVGHDGRADHCGAGHRGEHVARAGLQALGPQRHRERPAGGGVGGHDA